MHRREGIRHTCLRAIVLPAIILLSLLFASGCTGTPTSPPFQANPQGLADSSGSVSWKEIVLPDLQGRGNFSISRFAGKTVIMPLVSASCPGCIVQLNRQLAEIDQLVKQDPRHIVVISLDIDPDSGPDFITAYGRTAGFSGYSFRSPPELTLEIFHRFGPFSTDPATIPVIMVCPDGHDVLLPPGLKTAETINGSIVREC